MEPGNCIPPQPTQIVPASQTASSLHSDEGLHGQSSTQNTIATGSSQTQESNDSISILECDAASSSQQPHSATASNRQTRPQTQSSQPRPQVAHPAMMFPVPVMYGLPFSPHYYHQVPNGPHTQLPTTNGSHPQPTASTSTILPTSLVATDPHFVPVWSPQLVSPSGSLAGTVRSNPYAEFSIDGQPPAKKRKARHCLKCGSEACIGRAGASKCLLPCRDCGRMACQGRNGKHPTKTCSDAAP